jgi:probable addiction module antidote protein
MQESRELFFIALRNVAQARQMSSVAKNSELNRENLYRMLSSKGNPTYDSLNSVLKTVGLRLSVEPLLPTNPSLLPSGLRTSEIRQSLAKPASKLQGALVATFGRGKSSLLIAALESVAQKENFSASSLSGIHSGFGAASRLGTPTGVSGRIPIDDFVLAAQSATGEAISTLQLNK